MVSLRSEGLRLRRLMLLRDAAAISYLDSAAQTIRSATIQRAATLQAEAVASSTPIAKLPGYAAFVQQTEQDTLAFSTALRSIVTRQKAAAISNGTADAQTLIRLLDSSLRAGQPTNAMIARAIASAGVGRLGSLITSVGKSAARAITRAASLGASNRTAPSAAASQVDRMVSRASVILHHETMMAYRDAQQGSYNNTDGIDRWVWMSQLGRRTCPICYAKHGTTFPASQKFASHIGCRCVALPVKVGASSPLTAGETYFARLSRADKLAVLGPSRLAQYDEGSPLSDMVMEKDHPVWGQSLALKPLARDS